MSQLPRTAGLGPLRLRVTEEQHQKYQEAAERAGRPLATWIKEWSEVGAIWPAALKPLLEALHGLREEYQQTTRPIDLSWEGWEAFVVENLHRLPRLGKAP